MSGKHIALIVEDDRDIADDLVEILKSLECDSVVVDSKRGALDALGDRRFCFVLLDLEIKCDADSIKGHTEYGNSLLREIRRIHFDHTGVCYWLPVLIVSGFAREVPAAVDVMKDGGSDIIQKPFVARDVSAAVRSALERSGRLTHDLCSEKPLARKANIANEIFISITGERVKRRTRVLIDGQPVDLTDGCLRLLLHLMFAHMAGASVHKRALGASDDQGFKGVSILREAIKPALQGDRQIIANDYHGNYRLADDVVIGSCDTEKIVAIGDAKISALALKLDIARRAPKV